MSVLSIVLGVVVLAVGLVCVVICAAMVWDECDPAGGGGILTDWPDEDDNPMEMKR